MPSAIIYARVSTDKGAQDPENQALILRDMAQRLGLQVVKEYTDYASGGSGDRDEFKQMFKDMKGWRPGTTLLFFSLDRLSREGAFKTLEYLNTLNTSGITYKSYAEPYIDNDNPFKDAIIAIMATIAKQEKIRISERTKAGLARVKLKGSKSGKAIGRPRRVVDMERVRFLLQTKSIYGVAKEMGLSKSLLSEHLNGRRAPKKKPIWSEPIHGYLDKDGIFIEDDKGTVVIKYDRNNQTPYCINHRYELKRCRERHMQEIPVEVATQEVTV